LCAADPTRALLGPDCVARRTATLWNVSTTLQSHLPSSVCSGRVAETPSPQADRDGRPSDRRHALTARRSTFVEGEPHEIGIERFCRVANEFRGRKLLQRVALPAAYCLRMHADRYCGFVLRESPNAARKSKSLPKRLSAHMPTGLHQSV
jgi:hypothetical protein